MLRILGQAGRLCDGVTRRDAMRVGALSLFGMSLPRFLQAQQAQSATAPRLPFSHRPHGKAKSVILFNLLGGPSQMDMFDMKPLAPVEVRGEFQPIDTSLPGLSICEHLPNTAKWMHKACVIRTVTHTYDARNPLAMMTGFTQGRPVIRSRPATWSRRFITCWGSIPI